MHRREGGSPDSRSTLVIGYQTGMLRPVGFIEPCLPTGARSGPSGPQWVYEIKHDGFRFICWPAACGLMIALVPSKISRQMSQRRRSGIKRRNR